MSNKNGESMNRRKPKNMIMGKPSTNQIRPMFIHLKSRAQPPTLKTWCTAHQACEKMDCPSCLIKWANELICWEWEKLSKEDFEDYEKA